MLQTKSKKNINAVRVVANLLEIANQADYLCLFFSSIQSDMYLVY